MLMLLIKQMMLMLYFYSLFNFYIRNSMSFIWSILWLVAVYSPKLFISMCHLINPNYLSCKVSSIYLYDH